MTARTIDIVAIGPCPPDPYDPAASAWALAEGLAAAGDRVRVLHPTGPSPTAPPAGVESRPIELPRRRPGAAAEEATLAEAAGRQIRPDAEIVIRAPFGVGRLGVGARRRGNPPVVGIVHRLELQSYDAGRAARASGKLLDRVDDWRDRRSVRRLERSALAEADRLLYDSPELPEVLAREYGISAGRLRPVPPAVRRPVLSTDRTQARAALHLPLDVPVVVAPLCSADPAISGAGRVCDVFRRTRSLFAGIRLVIVGGSGPVEPGVTWVDDRETASFEQAFAAGDVALVSPTSPGFDPGVVLALRARCPVIAGPTVTFPIPAEGGVRAVPSNEPADLAAALVEMIADLAERRELGTAGERFAARFDAERIAALVFPSAAASR